MVSIEIAKTSPTEDVRTRVLADLARALSAEEDDEFKRQFEADYLASLDFALSGGRHPGRSWAGVHLTCSLLRHSGLDMYSNALSPIGWAGVALIDSALLGAGSPAGLLDTVPRGGPWQLGDGDGVFFGGWDVSTLREIFNAITAAESLEEETDVLLSAYKMWLATAIDSNMTVWGWIA